MFMDRQNRQENFTPTKYWSRSILHFEEKFILRNAIRKNIYLLYKSNGLYYNSTKYEDIKFILRRNNKPDTFKKIFLNLDNTLLKK